MGATRAQRKRKKARADRLHEKRRLEKKRFDERVELVRAWGVAAGIREEREDTVAEFTKQVMTGFGRPLANMVDGVRDMTESFKSGLEGLGVEVARALVHVRAGVATLDLKYRASTPGEHILLTFKQAQDSDEL